jgi:hypothetical protein
MPWRPFDQFPEAKPFPLMARELTANRQKSAGLAENIPEKMNHLRSPLRQLTTLSSNWLGKASDANTSRQAYRATVIIHLLPE